MPLTFPQMPDKLTANEAAVLEYITRNSDSFLFMSIAQLAAALDVSEATISRFARHVGCRDFKHLKQLVLEQTQPARPGPAGKLAATLADGDGALLPRWMEQRTSSLRKMSSGVTWLYPMAFTPRWACGTWPPGRFGRAA